MIVLVGSLFSVCKTCPYLGLFCAAKDKLAPEAIFDNGSATDSHGTSFPRGHCFDSKSKLTGTSCTKRSAFRRGTFSRNLLAKRL